MAVMKFEPAISGKFTTIDLPEGSWVQSIRGRLGEIEPVTLNWQSSQAWEKLPELLAIQANRLNGGAPQRTLTGSGVAVADAGAHLVRLTISQGSTDLVATGVITVPQPSIGPGGFKVTNLTVLFYACRSLYFYDGSTPEVVLS